MSTENDIPGLSRKEQERQRRRQAIIAAAQEAFIKNNGYYSATMAQIASMAEFSVGTLYQFFPNKQSLFAEVVLQDFEVSMTMLREKIAEQHSWREHLHTLIHYHLSWWTAENPDFLNMIREVFYSSIQDIEPSLLERFNALQTESLEILRRILGRAREEEGLSLDPDFMAVAIMGTLNAIYEYRNTGFISRTPTDYCADITRWITSCTR